MEKTIILLTKSRKMNNYCVAGIDVKSGEWIRVISEDEAIKHAIKEYDMQYRDGSLPRILDVVKLVCKKRQPSYYQPENWILDNRYYWEKIRRSTLHEVLQLNLPCNERYIFCNGERAVDDDELRRMGGSSRSLMLIQPQFVTIHVQQWEEKRKVTASFTYNGIRYKYLTITDLEYESKYRHCAMGDYQVQKNLYFVISLGDLYERDRKHYKLIATVLEE